jgi:hypothetical protein
MEEEGEEENITPKRSDREKMELEKNSARGRDGKRQTLKYLLG